MASPQPATKNRPSCISHPRGDWFVKINRGYVELCDGDRAGAFLLNFLEFRTNAFEDPEEAWIMISFRALAEELFGLVSASQLCRQASLLVERGFVEKREGDNRHSASYRLNLKVVTDALWELFDDLGNLRDSAFLQKRSVSPGTLSVSPETLKPNPSTSLLSKKVEDDNPPTPLTDHLDLDRPIDKWAEQQARERGLKLRITTGKQREALKTADSPDTRQQIIELFDREAAAGNSDVRDTLLRLVGIDRQRKPTGTFQRGRASAQSADRSRPEPPPSPPPPIAAEITKCQAEADMMGPVPNVAKLPHWKIVELEKFFAKDPDGFRSRLTATFERYRDQGVSSDAILAVFLDDEQGRSKAYKAPENPIDAFIKARRARSEA